MNDLAVLGLEGARDKYKELIDKILETSPDLEIHIISVTYTLEGEGKKYLTTQILRNTIRFCWKWHWTTAGDT